MNTIPLSLTDLVRLAHSDDPVQATLAKECGKLLKQCIGLIDERDEAELRHGLQLHALNEVVDKAQAERDEFIRAWALALDDGSSDAGTEIAAFRNVRRKLGDARAVELYPQCAVWIEQQHETQMKAALENHG